METDCPLDQKNFAMAVRNHIHAQKNISRYAVEVVMGLAINASNARRSKMTHIVRYQKIG
jgi:hypothetical protein